MATIPVYEEAERIRRQLEHVTDRRAWIAGVEHLADEDEALAEIQVSLYCDLMDAEGEIINHEWAELH